MVNMLNMETKTVIGACGCERYIFLYNNKNRQHFDKIYECKSVNCLLSDISNSFNLVVQP